MDYFKFWQLQSLYRPIYPYTPVALNAPTNLSSDDGDYVYGIPQENLLGFNYGLYKTPRVFPWVNDLSNILFDPDTKMYHRWGLYRDDGRLPGSWVEHVASSINGPWKQTQIAIPKAWLNDGTENGNGSSAGWTGCAPFIDWNNRFGYGKGTLFFYVAISGGAGKYNGKAFSQVGATAFAYAPAPEGKTNGLGAPVRKGGVIHSKTGGKTNCRVVYDSDHQQFLCTVSGYKNNTPGTDNFVQFWSSKGTIHKWSLLSTFVTEFSGIGCPNFNKIKDVKTGKTVWTLTCGKEAPGGKDPRQSVLMWVGSWNGRTFTPIKNLTSNATRTGACQLEYGSESFAPAMNDPYGYDGQRSNLPAAPDTLYWSTYLGNWAESVWDNPAYGYAGGTWETRGLKIKNNVPEGYPLSTYTKVDYQYQSHLHSGAISFPVDKVTKHWTSRLTMHQKAELKQVEIIYAWSNGNQVTMTWQNKGWTIDRQESGLFVYRNISNNPMPNPWLNGWADLIIHYDNSQFVFWDIINGRVASFWIFPDDVSMQGKSTTSVELERVTVNVVPNKNVGVDYYFGIKPLFLSPCCTKKLLVLESSSVPRA